MHRVWFAAIALAVASAASAQPSAPELLERTKAYQAASKAKDAAKVASFYAEDAVLLPHNSPAIVGRKAIEASTKEMFATADGELTATPRASEVSGELGYIRGDFVLVGTGRNGQKVTSKGKYVEVWKKIGGQWLIIIDMWNGDGPPPAPPTPPAPPMPPTPPTPKQ
jgi:uncharacterized protein (TIGR02246 family)